MAVIDHLDAPAQQRVTADPSAALRRACVFVLLLVVITGSFCALCKDVRRGFDELAHASYVAHIQHAGTMRPALDSMAMLDPANFGFTKRANYLNHPAPYYALLALLGPTLEHHPDAILVDRLLNVAFVAAGVAALMMVGLAARLSPLAFYAFIVPVICIPVLLPLAGSVNPDNAAFAGGALALLGAWQLITGERRAWLYVALGGLIVAAWAKLTGLLLVAGMLGGVFGWMHGRGRFARAWLIPVIAAFLVASAPYIAFIIHYGSPAPDTPAQSAMLEQAAHAAGWDRTRAMSRLAYALFFVITFTMEWMPSLFPRTALNYAALALPIGAVLCAGAGIVMSSRRILRREETPLDVIVVAGAVAFVSTFAIHAVFSYERYVAIGWLMDAYPRYYLPLAAIIPLAGLSLLKAVEPPRDRAVLIAFLIVGPIVFRILGVPLV